jgi:hypothetical protein
LGAYEVFFNEPFPLQDPGDRPVRRERGLELLQSPLDGGYPGLGIGFSLQTLPGGYNEILLLLARLGRAPPGSAALILEPVGIPHLVPVEPFKEPFFRALQVRVNALGRFAIYDMPVNGLLADIFFHRYSPFEVLQQREYRTRYFSSG